MNTDPEIRQILSFSDIFSIYSYKSHTYNCLASRKFEDLKSSYVDLSSLIYKIYNFELLLTVVNGRLKYGWKCPENR